LDFQKDGAAGLTIPRELIIPGVLIVLALGFDLLQYCLGTVIWYLFYRRQEKADVHEDADLDHSPYLPAPINIAFWLKVGCVFAAYLLILKFLVRALSFT
jgi:hypothetical protein